jgi:hypothetical protein
MPDSEEVLTERERCRTILALARIVQAPGGTRGTNDSLSLAENAIATGEPAESYRARISRNLQSP